MLSQSRLAGKKILITGASGFIGSHLCHRLINMEAELYAVSRDEQKDDKITWIHGDLSDLQFVDKAISSIEPDTVFHLASYVLGSRAMEVVIPTFESNLVSTLNILKIASEVKCRRIILTGSLEESLSDSKEIVPQAPYAAAKLAASAYARMFHALYETPVTIAKLFMVYGPDQKDLKKLIPYLILSLLRGEDPRFSSGTRLVDWIYVDDVVTGLIAVAEHENVEGKTIDIGSGKLTSIRDIVLKVYELMERKEKPIFGDLEDRPMEKEVVADIGKSKQVIHWEPMFSLENGLTETIAWYRDYYPKTS